MTYSNTYLILILINAPYLEISLNLIKTINLQNVYLILSIIGGKGCVLSVRWLTVAIVRWLLYDLNKIIIDCTYMSVGFSPNPNLSSTHNRIGDKQTDHL